ncbi:ankyrin repeat domain-containing protein [Wolbachia endosymbiont (group B) of Protocalliphora azurea]|uniref:ankyrin repeat domain-containing protein n=2 Tax=unclassified Wolbachia TaxID=2640676 RepID=UPI00222FADE8|nr:ankyrin repeat domain-containing protein [Wolbachia endosymbiont (group B) of Protocalliphora azurea]
MKNLIINRSKRDVANCKDSHTRCDPITDTCWDDPTCENEFNPTSPTPTSPTPTSPTKDDMLFDAVITGDYNKVKALLEEGANVNAKNSNGSTPLHLAAEKGILNIVEKLVENKADVNAKDYNGYTPLIVALNRDKLEIARFLTEKSAKSSGIPLLQYVAANSPKKAMELFINGDNVNTKDDDNRVLLHYAAESNSDPAVEYLISKNATINAKSGSCWTPLHYAAKNNNSEVSRLLIQSGAEVNSKSDLGFTPLHIAAREGNTGVVRFLIDNKDVDIYAKSNNDGNMPIHVAAENGKLEIVKIFVDKKPDIISVKNNYGNTVLHVAADNCHLNVVKYLVDEKGANVNAKNDKGRTPLDLAKRQESKDCKSVIDFLQAKSASRRRRDVQHSLSYPTKVKSPTSHLSNSLSSRDALLVGNSYNVKIEKTPQLAYGYNSQNNAIALHPSQVDLNSTISLLDVIVRKFTGQKYISTKVEGPSEQQILGYTLSINHAFEKAVKHAARESRIPIRLLDIDFLEVYKGIYTKVASNKLNEVPEFLSLYIEKACTGEQAAKLNSKKCNEFMAAFNNRLNVDYHKDADDTLPSSSHTEQQRSFNLQSNKPNNYLEDVSVNSTRVRKLM